MDILIIILGTIFGICYLGMLLIMVYAIEDSFFKENQKSKILNKLYKVFGIIPWKSK
jgi:hypothetical protein